MRKLSVYIRYLRIRLSKELRTLKKNLIPFYVLFTFATFIQRVVSWIAELLDSVEIYKTFLGFMS
jgi:hypothetical protein